MDKVINQGKSTTYHGSVVVKESLVKLNEEVINSAINTAIEKLLYRLGRIRRKSSTSDMIGNDSYTLQSVRYSPYNKIIIASTI